MAVCLNCNGSRWKPVVLDTGKHTTTFTRLYHVDDNSCVIGSPGFQKFGLHRHSEGMLEPLAARFWPQSKTAASLPYSMTCLNH